MFPNILLSLISTVVITPGDVPIVADIHPNENVWIQQIKTTRPEPDTLIVLPTVAASPFHYPPETVDLILQVHFYEPVGLDWARRVGFCESSWNINALGALGEVGWFQHRPEFWEYRSALAGYPDGDIWDPQINTAVAAFMFYSPDFGPSHWSCK